MSNSNTLGGEREKCDDCISLLKMIIQMKEKEEIEEKILKKGNEPLIEWLQIVQFKLEIIQEAKEGLKDIGEKVKKT